MLQIKRMSFGNATTEVRSTMRLSQRSQITKEMEVEEPRFQPGSAGTSIISLPPLFSDHSCLEGKKCTDEAENECSAGFHTLYLAFAFGLCIDVVLQIYQWFMVSFASLMYTAVSRD